MKVRLGRFYTGIRLCDIDKNCFVDETWSSRDAEWTPLEDAKLPQKTSIIGFKCDTEVHPAELFPRLTSLSFLLGHENKTGIYQEIRFPAWETYPSP